MGTLSVELPLQPAEVLQEQGPCGRSFGNLVAFDWLVVLGGPMNIYEDDAYPWLVSEKTFIENPFHGAARQSSVPSEVAK